MWSLICLTEYLYFLNFKKINFGEKIKLASNETFPINPFLFNIVLEVLSKKVTHSSNKSNCLGKYFLVFIYVIAYVKALKQA